MKNKIITFLSDNKFKILVLILYFIIVFITMLNHEMWRDEARVWVNIASRDFFQILEFARDDGHPPLWYILLFPFVKLNFPPITMQIISFLLVFSGVCYFMFKSPFNKLFNVLFIFSAGMLYYLPVIAKNYALIPLLLFMLAEAYKTRAEKPYRYVTLLLLLSLTHSLMWGFCLICSFLFICEKVAEYIKEKKLSVLLPLIIPLLNLFVMAFFYIKLATEENRFTVICFEHLLPSYFIQNEFGHLHYISSLNDVSLVSVLLILFVSFVLLIVKNYKSSLILAVSFFYINFILTCVWYGGIIFQKSFIYFLILLFCIWITISKDIVGRWFNVLLTVMFFILLFSPDCMPFYLVKEDIYKTFSFGKKAANYLNNNVNENEGILFLGNDIAAESLYLWLPRNYKFHYLHVSDSFCNSSGGEQIEKYLEENFLDVRYIIDFRCPESEYLNDEKYEKKYLPKSRRMASFVGEPEIFDIYYRNE